MEPINLMQSKEVVDFIGIGSAKSGSSWVAACLEEHPQINIAKEKSLFFFNSEIGNEYIKDNWSNWHKGFKWYLGKFPPVDNGKIRGEFGVSYLHDDAAPKRIKKLFPTVKILVTLRNPVDMLYSLYWYNVNTVEASVPKTFEEAVDKKWCLDRGNYYKYLKRYYDIYPKENIHVILLDDVKNDPKKVVVDLYRFLGVDESFTPSILEKRVYEAIGYRLLLLKSFGSFVFSLLRKLKLDKVRRIILDTPIFYSIYSYINVVPKSYPQMSASLRSRLIAYYRDDVRKLEKLINRDLSMWDK